MSRLDSIINQTQILQDVELATAVGELKQDPSKLQLFLQNQQNQVFSDIIRQKDTTFQKVYGDLNHATKAQESVVMYNKRNKELSDLQDYIYNSQKSNAEMVNNDKNMATRKHEMNEWSVGNKNDTLFVFSSLFIMLSALILITVLWRMKMISSYLWVMLGAPVIIIFVLIVINRSQYTDVLRNKRYWNKQIHEVEYGKIPLPLCPGAVEAIQGGVQSLGEGVVGGLNVIGQGISTVGSGLSGVGGNIQYAASQANAAMK